jgi:hypothetical protein
VLKFYGTKLHNHLSCLLDIDVQKISQPVVMKLAKKPESLGRLG